MPPKQIPFCRVCDKSHPQPVGRNCRRSQSAIQSTATSRVETPNDQNLVIPSTSSAPSTSISNDIASRLMEKLDNVAGKIESIDQRVSANERAMAASNAPPSQYNHTPAPLSPIVPATSVLGDQQTRRLSPQWIT